MSSIDERVVEMKFDNAQFERGISQTTSSLDALKKGLKLDGAQKGLEDVQAASSRFSLANVVAGAQNVGLGFMAMATVGITALANLTSAAMNAGSQLVKSLTLDPIMAGFQEYELKMGSIQTILANTSRHGTGLEDVTRTLDELNTYADKTIYNFGDMTRNIGLFTNAGLKLEESASMIQGFSNMAAVSGTNSQQAAGAAYQLSQALSAGTIRLMDWRSLTNVNMGNKNMQIGLIEIADAMGTLNSKTGDASKLMSSDFNQSLEHGWLSAGVMSTYLQIMAGDMDAAKMASLGLSEAQIASFQEQQKTAEEAATKVRTWTQLIGTMQEGVGSAWASTFDLLIGDFNQATEMFTNINDTLGPLISAAGETRNRLIKEWIDLGGRDRLIDGLSRAFDTLMLIVGPIKLAFKEIFPAATGTQITSITDAIVAFLDGLKPTGNALSDIKATAKGFFALLDIGRMIIMGVVDVVMSLFGQVSDGTGSFLDITASIGDFIVGLRDAMKDGTALSTFFGGLKSVLAIPIASIQILQGFISELFNSIGDGGPGFEGFFARIGERMAPLGRLGEIISSSLGSVGTFFADMWAKAQPIITAIGDALGQLGTWIGDAFQNADWGLVLEGINVGLFAGLVILIQRFLGGGGLIGQLKDLFKGGAAEGGGFMDSIKEMFGGVTETLSAMQAQLKAKTLLTLASAIALLAGSMLILALIDPARLASATLAMTAMFVQLGGAMMIFEKYVTGPNIAKMVPLTTAMILLSVAVLILSTAVAKMAGLSWEELAKGLGGMIVILAALAGFAKAMQKNTASLVGLGFALVILGAGMHVMAGALKSLAEMSVDDLIKGIGALAGVFAILAGLTRAINPAKVISMAIGIAILGGAMHIFAAAIGAFAGYSLEQIGTGLLGIGGALAVVAGAMHLMPKGMVLQAVALTVVAAALLILADVLGKLGGMSMDQIGAALGALAGGLIIIAIAMAAMQGALAGAAALIIVVAALSVLVPLLMALGSMPWQMIGGGLLALAAAFAVIGLAGLILTPIIPSLLILGAAVTLLGIGALAAGTAMLAFGLGLSALAAIGAVAGAGLVLLFTNLASLIPMLMQQIGLGIIAFANVIAQSGPALVGAMVTVLMSLITAITTVVPAAVEAVVTLILALVQGVMSVAPVLIDAGIQLIWQMLQAIQILVPEFVNTAVILITALVNAVVAMVPFLVESGLRLIVGLLNGIANQIGAVVDAGFRIVTEFMAGISRNIPKLLQQGANMIIDFVNGLANTIRNNQSRMESAGSNLASAIIDGMTSGIRRGIDTVVNAARRMAESALNAAKNFLGIASPSKEFTKLGMWSAQGLGGGIDKFSYVAERASENMASNALSKVKDTMSQMSDVMASDLDMSPTIRPVLDLSAIESGAALMPGLFGTPRLKLDAAVARANDVSAEYDATQDAIFDAYQPGETTQLVFNQHNTSPKALSDVDIYRQTNNQISSAKEALKLK